MQYQKNFYNMADEIMIEGKKIYPERKKYERTGNCPKCNSKNYTYIEIDKEYSLQCHAADCKLEMGAPYTAEGIKSILTNYKEYYGN